VPNFSHLEVRVSPTENLYLNAEGVDEAEAMFSVQPRLSGTGYPISDAPGLGVEFNEALAASQPWHFGEFPHWRRGDGSVTNW
jgi:galactonate dehydratase